MIELEHVSKSFGSVKAIDGISLRVETGELFSFLGPNGAGKTTMIKMIVGLMSPDSGRILLNGIDVAKEPVRAKKIIGYVPDAPFLYEKLTGREFLSVIGNLRELPASEIAHQIELYRERLDMGEWLHNKIEAYSQGMKQRILFVSALLHSPKVVVIDEPMVALDPKTARAIKDLLKEKSRGGVTIFLSTHNLSVAEELSDRIAIIHKGKLLGVGPVHSFRGASRPDGNLEDLFLEIVAQGDSSPNEHLSDVRIHSRPRS